MIEVLVTVVRVRNGAYSSGWVESEVHRLEFDDDSKVEAWLERADVVAREQLKASD